MSADLQGVETSGPSRARRQEIRTATFAAHSGLIEVGGNEAARNLGYDDVEDWFETQVREFRRLKMPPPERPGWMRTDDWDAAALVALADQLGRKLDSGDVTPGLRRFATEWIRGLEIEVGTLPFLVDVKASVVGGRKLSVGQAKGVLNCAVAQARRDARPAPDVATVPVASAQAAPAPVAELESGVYLHEGEVYKVKRAVHGSGRMYALVLIKPAERGAKARFEYARGVVFKITADERMTLEQAREFGAIYGVCCNCGATLTNEDSIEAGIGPVCAKKFA